MLTIMHLLPQIPGSTMPWIPNKSLIKCALNPTTMYSLVSATVLVLPPCKLFIHGKAALSLTDFLQGCCVNSFIHGRLMPCA